MVQVLQVGVRKPYFQDPIILELEKATGRKVLVRRPVPGDSENGSSTLNALALIPV